MDHPDVLSIAALPLTLLEYYSTKERVTLEAQNEDTPSVPFANQLKAIFTDKYMLIIYAYFLIYVIGSTIKKAINVDKLALFIQINAKMIKLATGVALMMLKIG